MKVFLEQHEQPEWRGGVAHNGFLRSSEPFVENSRGILIHRPRSVDFYQIPSRPPHLAIHYWCGAQTTGTKNLTFLSAPPDGRLVCHACENRALMAKQKSSTELAGRHVCTGKLRAYNSCAVHGEHP